MIIKKSAVKDKGLIGTEIEFYVVNTIKELAYYIMDRDSEQYHNDESGRTFDRINAVLINGDCKYVPWHEMNNEIYILIKMCIQTKTTIFCTSGAMQTFVFQISIDMDPVF